MVFIFELGLWSGLLHSNCQKLFIVFFMSHDRYLLLLKRNPWIHSFHKYELSLPFRGFISLLLKMPNISPSSSL